MLQSDHQDPLAVIDGVQSGLALTKLTGMGFNIGVGRSAINGSSPVDGAFAAAVLSDEAGAFDPGDASYDRIDLITLAITPTLPADQACKVTVIKGGYNTAGGAPTIPATPAGSLPLYAVTISAGMSAGNGGWDISKVQDLRRKIGVPKFISYSPNWSGLNLGTGAVREGRYRIDGDKVSVNVHLRGGAGASWAAGQLCNFSLPVPAADGYLYYGNGGVHHPTLNGLAYDLRVFAIGSSCLVFAPNSAGALAGPGAVGYPFAQGTEVFATLEYIAANV